MSEKKEIRLKDETEFFSVLKEVKKESRLQETEQYIQHGVTSVYRHSLAVAYFSCYLAEKLHLKVRTKEMIRGALLHDYFLYDWHKHPHVGITNLHGFRHPQRALENAEKEYNLTPRERDIIVKHMWPLTVLPPTCREAWIVTTADKWCSLLETFRILKGHGAKRKDKMQENE